MVEIYAVTRAKNDHAILMVKLCAPNLVLEGLVPTLLGFAVGRAGTLLTLLVFVDAVDVQEPLAFLLPVEVPDDAGLVGGAADQVLVVRTPANGVDLPVVALQRGDVQIVLEFPKNFFDVQKLFDVKKVFDVKSCLMTKS